MTRPRDVDLKLAQKVFNKLLQDQPRLPIRVFEREIVCAYASAFSKLRLGDRPEALTRGELRALDILKHARGKIVPYDDIHVRETAARSTIKRMRQKMPSLNIVNFSGRGYSLDPDEAAIKTIDLAEVDQ